MNSQRSAYKALQQAVKKAQVDYHTHDAPTIADDDYDGLVKQLRGIEHANPSWLTGPSVTDNVGAPLKRGLYPVKHTIPMQSLNNVFTVAALQDMIDGWQGGHSHVSFKYDGLACSLTYRDRRLVQSATRGDGSEGESILHNVLGYDSIPKSLPPTAPATLEVRGELIMYNDEFHRYNQRLSDAGKPLAINPRNAAAGVARRLTASGKVGAQLVFMPYAIHYPNGGGPANYEQAMTQLATYGFEMPYFPEPAGERDLYKYIVDCQKKRSTLPFAIDGLVFRVTDYALCEKLGSTSKAPRWAIAYKFAPEEKSTRIFNIRLQIGRTGNATPVAELDPVVVGGVTVTNATLHNEDFIKDLKLAIGDTVIVRRAGDVVPEIAAVVKRPKERELWEFPTVCECGAPIVRPAGLANHLCTGGYTCPFQKQRSFEHFVSRNALDIDGVGEELIEKLLAAGKLTQLPDLFKLDEQDILDVTSQTSQRIAAAVINSINKGRTTTLQRYLYSLGIPMAGAGTAKGLHEWFGSFDLIAGAGQMILRAVPDIGTAVAASIETFFIYNHWACTLIHEGVIELTDETGPCPAFAQYMDVSKLLALSNIPRVTAKSAPKYAGWLKRVGYPEGETIPCKGTPEDELEWAGIEHFLRDNAQCLEDLLKDWQLVRDNLGRVRKVQSEQPLSGQTYVITGSFDETLGTREQIGAQLEALGAKVSGSVSAKTTGVLVGESPGKNKIDKATQWAVPILYSQDLRHLLTVSQ